MSNIANKRNDYNDAFERLAEQEAQREAERLQEVSWVLFKGLKKPLQTVLLMGFAIWQFSYRDHSNTVVKENIGTLTT